MKKLLTTSKMQVFSDSKIREIEKSGNYIYVGIPDQGLVKVARYIDGAFLFGFIDTTNCQEVVPCVYDDVSIFYKGGCRVRKGNKFGIINKKGKFIVNLKFDKITHFGCSELNYQPKYALGKIGEDNYIIHTSGDVVGPISYEGIKDLHTKEINF